MRIALISAARDRHERQLLAAFERLEVEAHAFELADIAFDSEARHGLVLPHFGELLPDAVCVRTMDAGSFEQVTRRLGALHALAALGVGVSNDARAIEACTDKSMTSFLLARAGLPSPRSHAVESLADATRILARNGAPMVLKPLFGAQGKGLMLIHDASQLPAPQALGGVYYLQAFVDHRQAGAYCDYRIMVSRGRVVAAMMRRSHDNWITNIKQGAAGVAMNGDFELESLAVAAAAAVGADFCGVDLMRGPNAEPYVIEVNSMPAWTGLEQATGLDIAGMRAADLLAGWRARQAAAHPLRRVL